MELKKYSIEKFIGDLKGDLSSPGGGSTAALVSALALSLNSMVYSFTIDKKSFEKLSEEEKEKMKILNEECSEFIKKSLDFMDEDRRIFTELMDSFKLPKEDQEDKKKRSEVIREKTIIAMNVPFELAKSALGFYSNIEFAIKYGNKNLTSDAIVSAILLHSAIESAIVNVFVNFNNLGNKEGYENIPNECKEILELSFSKKTEIVKSFII